MGNYNFKDLTGKKIGRLTIIKRISEASPIKWLCRCDCGNYTEVFGYNLTRLHTTSCGCFNKEQNKKRIVKKENNVFYKHGKSDTKLHSLWRSMIGRCYNTNNKAYKNYGGRGIKVCEEWKNDFMSFYNWAISNGYNEMKNKFEQSLDRINVNDNYKPDNCRWATAKQQANNKRNNHIIEYKGEKHNIAEWAKIYNMKRGTLQARLNVYNWDIKKALETPIKEGRC